MENRFLGLIVDRHEAQIVLCYPVTDAEVSTHYFVSMDDRDFAGYTMRIDEGQHRPVLAGIMARRPTDFCKVAGVMPPLKKRIYEVSLDERAALIKEDEDVKQSMARKDLKWRMSVQKWLDIHERDVTAEINRLVQALCPGYKSPDHRPVSAEEFYLIERVIDEINTHCKFPSSHWGEILWDDDGGFIFRRTCILSGKQMEEYTEREADIIPCSDEEADVALHDKDWRGPWFCGFAADYVFAEGEWHWRLSDRPVIH